MKWCPPFAAALWALALAVAPETASAAAPRRLRPIEAGPEAANLSKTVARLHPAGAASQLLHFLEGPSTENSTELPAFSVFLPACLAHLKSLVKAVDHSFTDQQP